MPLYNSLVFYFRIQQKSCKGPCKRSQHCWPTRRNIVGPNMLRAFAHHVVCCCVLLRLVGSCWMKFETGQTSSNNFQQVATTHNMVCKRSQHVGPNNVASCWPTMLRAFARAFLTFSFLMVVVGWYVIKKCLSKSTRDILKGIR